jgi:hypothetical protein
MRDTSLFKFSLSQEVVIYQKKGGVWALKSKQRTK